MATRRLKIESSAPTAENKATNIITHVVLVLDRSGSMYGHTNKLIQVADGYVKSLAEQSKAMNQEWRISVYAFDDSVQCLIWDMDVLRTPSISDVYKAGGGMTALMDATAIAINDLRTIPVRYGDHSFLMFVLTDGAENASRGYTSDSLKRLIGGLNDTWTLGALVPDTMGVMYAKKYGFPAGNIDKWDTKSEHGVESAGERIATATGLYMSARATNKSYRGTRTLFSMDDATLNEQAVDAADLQPLNADEYTLCVVPHDTPIREFVEREMGLQWIIGRGYYQLKTRVKVQAQKKLAIVEKKTNKVYMGNDARQLLGLPDYEVSISAAFNTRYDVFIQSTSVNRKLLAGQRFLWLNHN